MSKECYIKRLRSLRTIDKRVSTERIRLFIAGCICLGDSELANMPADQCAEVRGMLL